MAHPPRQDLPHPGADVLAVRFRLRANLVALDDRERGDGRRRAQRVGVEGALMADFFPPAALAAAGSSWSMMSARPATAPPGSPPATILASTHMSGMTPKRACAPPRDQRKPVMTSSRISTTPRSLGHGAQAGEETLRQRHHAPRSAGCLEDHGRDVVARFERLDVATASRPPAAGWSARPGPMESPPAREPSKCDIDPAAT